MVAGSLTPCPSSIETSKPARTNTCGSDPNAALKKTAAESRASTSPFQRTSTAIVMMQMPPIVIASMIGPKDLRR